MVVIINSLAPRRAPVHSKYSYHKPLLQARVEVYEIKPTASALRGQRPGSVRGQSRSEAVWTCMRGRSTSTAGLVL